MNHLKQIIQDLINDQHEQAQVAVHEYIVSKTQQLIEGKTDVTSEIDTIYALGKAGGLDDFDGVVGAIKVSPRLYYVASKDSHGSGYIINAFRLARNGKSGDFDGAPMDKYPSKAAAVQALRDLAAEKTQ